MASRKNAARPYVLCHMMGSVDGRIQSDRWGYRDPARFFEDQAAKLDSDGWIVGRTTMQEFSSQKPRAKRRGAFRVPKTDHVADPKAKSFAIGIDPSGKNNWERGDVDGDHVIMVLSERVSGEYLDHLRAAGCSYIFAGKRDIDLARVLTKLHRLFGIRRVTIQGGGGVNGSFLKADLIDELSLVLVPVADGSIGTPTVFDAEEGHTRRLAMRLRLESVKRIEKDLLWLRYKKVRPTQR